MDGGSSRPSAESPVVRVEYLGHEDVREVFIRRQTGDGAGEGEEKETHAEETRRS